MQQAGARDTFRILGDMIAGYPSQPLLLRLLACCTPHGAPKQRAHAPLDCAVPGSRPGHRNRFRKMNYTALNSDPGLLGWMRGHPPDPARRINIQDGSARLFPQIRWAFSHSSELLPVRSIDRGQGPISLLGSALRDDLDAVQFQPLGRATSMSWRESLEANFTDGIVVLHRGAIVYEAYFGALSPRGQHLCASVTKSLVGTLAAWLVHDGLLDPHAPVAAIIPELAGSGFAKAVVEEVMHMTTAIRYDETYADPQADIWQHLRAGGLYPRPKDYSGPVCFADYLRTVSATGEHGRAFTYRTPNTDVLGWMIRSICDKPLAQVIEERLWQPMGAERDALMQVDQAGFDFAGGGLLAVLRDLARFGELMRNDGRVGSQQVVPQEVVRGIRRGADPAHFAAAGYALLKGWSYASMWWIAHDDHQVFTARGVHGQTIYVDPCAEMVIARFASHPLAANMHLDPTSLPAYRALAVHLMRES